jgi:hypothetical protein
MSILKSFKKCNISNALDGTEGDALFEESESLSSNISDERDSSFEVFWGFCDINVVPQCVCLVSTCEFRFQIYAIKLFLKIRPHFWVLWSRKYGKSETNSYYV